MPFILFLFHLQWMETNFMTLSNVSSFLLFHVLFVWLTYSCIVFLVELLIELFKQYLGVVESFSGNNALSIDKGLCILLSGWKELTEWVKGTDCIRNAVTFVNQQRACLLLPKPHYEQRSPEVIKGLCGIHRVSVDTDHTLYEHTCLYVYCKPCRSGKLQGRLV